MKVPYRNILSLKERIHVIRQHKYTPNAWHLARLFNCGRTQIQSILRYKKEYLQDWARLQNELPPRLRKPPCPMQRAIAFILIEWIKCNQRLRIEFTDDMFRKTAQEIANHLNYTAFRPNNRWLERFKLKYRKLVNTQEIDSDCKSDQAISNLEEEFTDIYSIIDSIRKRYGDEIIPTEDVSVEADCSDASASLSSHIIINQIPEVTTEIINVEKKTSKSRGSQLRCYPSKRRNRRDPANIGLTKQHGSIQFEGPETYQLSDPPPSQDLKQPIPETAPKLRCYENRRMKRALESTKSFTNSFNSTPSTQLNSEYGVEATMWMDTEAYLKAECLDGETCSSSNKIKIKIEDEITSNPNVSNITVCSFARVKTSTSDENDTNIESIATVQQDHQTLNPTNVDTNPLTCTSPKEINNYAAALEYLRPLEEFVLYDGNIRATGLLNQLENMFKDEIINKQKNLTCRK